MKTTRRAVPAVGLLATLLSLVSCGGGEEDRNYAIPPKLCGVEIDEQLLEPLLPGGDKIKIEPWSQIPSCSITIDSATHSTMAIRTYADPLNPGSRVKAAKNLNSDQIMEWDVEDGGVIWLADELSGSEIAFDCPYENPATPYALFSFEIGGAGQIDDEDERVERIKEFSLNYLEGIERSLCNE